MFNINFDNLIKFLLPIAWRKARHFYWLKLVLSQLRKIYDEFLALRESKLYDLNFTGQVIYLEKKLNDAFSCEGILIADVEYHTKLYLFNKGEDFLPVYAGNLWKEGVFYNTGDWIVYDNFWYEYVGHGSGASPDTDQNARQRDEIETYIGNSDEDFYNYDFTVNVPAAVYATFSSDDILKLKKIIEYYRFAEMRYKIKTY